MAGLPSKQICHQQDMHIGIRISKAAFQKSSTISLARTFLSQTPHIDISDCTKGNLPAGDVKRLAMMTTMARETAHMHVRNHAEFRYLGHVHRRLSARTTSRSELIWLCVAVLKLLQ